MPTGRPNQSGLFWREIVIDLFLPKQQENTEVLWLVGFEAVDADANKNGKLSHMDISSCFWIVTQCFTNNVI